MIPAVLAKIGIPVLASILSDALTRVDHPVAKGASRALGDLDDALLKGQISREQIAEANRHAEKMAEMRLKETETLMTEINQSLRTEVTSEDKFVRRMRPTFGYLMAATWAVQMLAVAYIMVFRTPDLQYVLEAAEALSLIWTVALSVLGIYVYKRSEEKRRLF